MQKDGMLPSAALKKIEIERRLGIVPEDTKTEGFFDETVPKIALGAIGLAIIYVYVKSKSGTQQTMSMDNIPLPLDSISGIDLESLYIARNKGLI